MGSVSIPGRGLSKRNLRRKKVPTAPDSTPAVEGSATRPDAEVAPPRALVVDDAPGVRTALARALRDAGLEVDLAADEATAMQILEERWVDLVIVEHRPPELCGIAFLESVRSAHPHVHRIVMTGEPTFAVVREAINRAGVSFILTKPWDAGSLREALRHLTGGVRASSAGEPVGLARVPRESVRHPADRAADCAQRILAALNACDCESEIRSVLHREFARIAAADGFWWIGTGEDALVEYDAAGEVLRARGIDALAGADFEAVERARRAGSGEIIELGGREAPGSEFAGGALLALPLRLAEHELGSFGVLARRASLLSGIPREVSLAIGDGVAFALQRAGRLASRATGPSRARVEAAAQLGAVDVQVLLSETVDKLRRLPDARARARVLMSAGEAVPRLRADRRHLERVLWNLLLDATASLDGSGTLRLSARRRRRGGRRGVEICVEDALTGAGAEANARGSVQHESGTASGTGGTRVAFWLPVA